jgi:pseudoazurin
MSRFGFMIAAMLLAVPVTAHGADATVEMLNKDPNSKERNIYAPGLVQVEPGDTVSWIAADRGHNIEFVQGAFPEGVDRFRSSLGKDVSYTFTVPGIYVYKCTPHYGLGMVGAVVVGEIPDNVSDIMAKKFPGKADARIDALLSPLL